MTRKFLGKAGTFLLFLQAEKNTSACKTFFRGAFSVFREILPARDNAR
jgi:hypothetical protein